MKNLFAVSFFLFSFSAFSSNDFVEGLKNAPESLCQGNPKHDVCVVAANRMISAIYQVTIAGTMCEENKEKIPLLDENDQRNCKKFKEAMEYMKTLKQ